MNLYVCYFDSNGNIKAQLAEEKSILILRGSPNIYDKKCEKIIKGLKNRSKFFDSLGVVTTDSKAQAIKLFRSKFVVNVEEVAKNAIAKATTKKLIKAGQ